VTTLVVLLFISNIFGGNIHAALTFESIDKCQAFKRSLSKYTIKHAVVQDCKDEHGSAR
jgi:hypothetical protein